MKGLIVATHGNLSRELVRSAEMVAGPIESCHTWTLNPEDNVTENEERMIEMINLFHEEDDIFIMLDLFGGTPSNLILKNTKGKNVKILTGVNLPMILEFAMSRDSLPAEELMEVCEDAGKYGIKNINKMLQKGGRNNG